MGLTVCAIVLVIGVINGVIHGVKGSEHHFVEKNVQEYASPEIECVNGICNFLTNISITKTCSTITVQANLRSNQMSAIRCFSKLFVKTDFLPYDPTKTKEPPCSFYLKKKSYSTKFDIILGFSLLIHSREWLGYYNCNAKIFTFQRYNFCLHPTTELRRRMLNVIHTISVAELAGFKNLPSDIYPKPILSLIASLNNFSIEFIRAEGLQFAAFVNNTWTGVLGLVTEQKADMAYSVSPTAFRAEYVRFSHHYISKSQNFIYRKLSHKKWNLTGLLKPYPQNVWFGILAVLGSALLLAVVLFFVKQLENAVSIRIISLTYNLFYLIILATYASLLTSAFAIIKYNPPFESLKDLVQKQDYFPILIQGWGSTDDFMRVQFEPWKSGQKLVKKNMPHSMPENHLVALETMWKMKGAVLAPKEEVFTFVERNCSFEFSKKPYGFISDSIAYSKDFPFRDLFDIELQKLREVGILFLLETRRPISEWHCPEEYIFAISVKVIAGILVAFASGIFFSSVILLLELRMWRMAG